MALVEVFQGALGLAEKSVKWRSALRRSAVKNHEDFFNFGVELEEIDDRFSNSDMVLSHALTCSLEYLEMLVADILSQIVQCRKAGAVLELHHFCRFLPVLALIPLPALSDFSKRIATETEAYYLSLAAEMDRSCLAYFDEVMKLADLEKEMWGEYLPTLRLSEILSITRNSLVCKKVPFDLSKIAPEFCSIS